MSIKGDSATVREMKSEIAATIRDLEGMSQGISSGLQARDGWDDNKAAEFNMAMSRVSRQIASPIDELKAALPKLERLAELMDAYTSKNFK